LGGNNRSWANGKKRRISNKAYDLPENTAGQSHARWSKTEKAKKSGVVVFFGPQWRDEKKSSRML
jgi:hypothetical protein